MASVYQTPPNPSVVHLAIPKVNTGSSLVEVVLGLFCQGWQSPVMRTLDSLVLKLVLF